MVMKIFHQKMTKAMLVWNVFAFLRNKAIWASKLSHELEYN